MNPNPITTFSFTKLVVHDLEQMAQFYTGVFGLTELQRLQDTTRADPMEEIILGSSEDFGARPTLVLLKYLERSRPQPGAVILGFVTTDLDALVDSAHKAGGQLSGEVEEHQEAHVRVAMVIDPEGHTVEVVQMLAQ